MYDKPFADPRMSSDDKETSRARSVALRLLAAKSRSAAEIRERLSRRFAKETVEHTVAHLIDGGLLNDAEFAQQWRRSRETRKPRSRRMIEQELRQRGIADDLIDNALQDYDSQDAAYRAAARYAARQARSDQATFARRVGAFLERRGFEPAVVRRTLQRLREELEVGAPFAVGPAYDQP